MTARICARCAWWQATSASTGTCRINAPVVIANPDPMTYEGGPYLSVFPITQTTDWCRRWSEHGTATP